MGRLSPNKEGREDGEKSTCNTLAGARTRTQDLFHMIGEIPMCMLRELFRQVLLVTYFVCLFFFFHFVLLAVCLVVVVIRFIIVTK